MIIEWKECMNDDEQALLELLATSLDSTFRQLVLCYQDRLYAFALRLTGSAQDAEDTVQEALFGAYIALLHYTPERIHALKLRGWLYKLTLNVFRNSKRGARPLMILLDASEEDLMMSLPDNEELRPDMLYEHTERMQELTQVLAQLPGYYRVVIICFYFENLSQTEIAQLLDQPLGTVKSRLHRAMRLLRQKLLAQQQKGDVSTYGR
jgi:RNA polymerase sigma-70 factor, ECF subfamily